MKRIDISTPKLPGFFALVDDQDYEWLNQWKWSPNFQYEGAPVYARRWGKSGGIYMHREIMGAMADHVDGNGLNNQRANLRLCDRAQNAWNRKKILRDCSSKYKGVRFHKRDRRYIAQITVNHKYRYIGSFPSEILAAKAYNKAALELFGEFAKLNKIPDSPEGHPTNSCLNCAYLVGTACGFRPRLPAWAEANGSQAVDAAAPYTECETWKQKTLPEGSV